MVKVAALFLSLAAGSAFADQPQQGIPTIIFADKQLEEAKATIVGLKTEIERLKTVIQAKDNALGVAMKTLSLPMVPVASVSGNEYVEEALGKVVVRRNGGKIVVAVLPGSEQKADNRFLGAVNEKQRAADGRIIYTLDAAKLKKGAGF